MLRPMRPPEKYGDVPPPDEFEQGAAIYDEGLELTQQFQFWDGAQAFLEAASIWNIESSNYASLLLAARKDACANAWECFRAAGAEEDGRAGLLGQAEGPLREFILALLG